MKKGGEGRTKDSVTPLALAAYIRRLEEQAKHLIEDKESLGQKVVSLSKKLETQAAALKQSQSNLSDAKRMAKERKELFDELKKKATRGRQTTPVSTTRGITASLAKSLDSAKADLKTGMRKHDEILHNYDVVLHESPKVVLEALLRNR